MTRIRTWHATRFVTGTALLYREELERILDIVGQPVKFEVGQFEYDSLDAVRDDHGDRIGPQLQEIRTAPVSNVRITFAARHIAVWSDREDGTAERIRDVLRTNPRRFTHVVDFGIPAALGIVAQGLFFRERLTWSLFAVGELMTLALVPWMRVAFPNVGTLLILRRRHEYGSMYARHRELVNALLAALAGALATYWLTRG